MKQIFRPFFACDAIAYYNTRNTRTWNYKKKGTPTEHWNTDNDNDNEIHFFSKNNVQCYKYIA